MVEISKIIKPTVKHVVPSEAYFEITGINYKGNIHTYRLYDKMTSSMKQDNLAEFYNVEKKKGNPHPMDSILHFSIMNAAEKSKNSDLMNFLRDGLRKYPNTLSRVIYNPSGKDEAIHNYGTSEIYSLKGDIVGPDGWIKEISDKKALDLLLGTKNAERINKVSNSINKTPMYLWRVNSKPSEKIECVVGFDASGGGLVLSTSGVLSDGYPAFRVLQVD